MNIISKAPHNCQQSQPVYKAKSKLLHGMKQITHAAPAHVLCDPQAPCPQAQCQSHNPLAELTLQS